MIEYPTRKGIAVPTREVWLPESRLNPNNPHNYNLHHREFTIRKMAKFTITRLLKDLEGTHELLLKDIHNMGRHTLHTIYGPPRFPTPAEAMDRLDEAYEMGEMLELRNYDTGHYDLFPFTKADYDNAKREYERVR